MDVVSLGKNSLRIKGKNGSIIIDPVESIAKIEAQALLVLKNGSDFDDSKVEGSRISVKGPGEYEVSGIKISALKSDPGIVARIDVDNVKVLVGEGSSIEKIQDKLEESQVVVVKADSAFNYSVLTTLEPKVILVYGLMSDEVGKALGKEGVKTVKYSTTSEKLPQELELYFL